MERRKFIRGAGILGLFAAGAVGMKEVTAPPVVINNTHIHSKTPEIDPKMVALIEEISPASITLTSTYGEVKPPPPPQALQAYEMGDGSYRFSGSTGAVWSTLTVNQLGGLSVNAQPKQFVPGTEKDIALKLVPGPDGELYLNINGQWKKVLTTS